MRKLLLILLFIGLFQFAWAQTQISGSAVQIGGTGVQTTQGTQPILVNGVSGTPQAGDITVSCPTCGASQQMQITYQPPIAGQYIVMYPLTCSTNSSSAAAGSCSTLSNAGSLTVNRWSSGSTVTPTDVYAISTGWAYNGVAGLPSFVSAANVTAVYGVEWAYSTSTYGNLSNFIAGIAMGTPGHGGIGWTPYSAKVDGGSPTTFNFATTTATLHNNSSGNSGPVNDLTTVYPALIVYYTGSAPPATSTVPVNPPFTFSASGLGLQWPFNYSGDTGASGSAYAISLPFLLKNVNGSVFNNISSGADVWFDPAHTNTVTNPTLNLNGYYPGIGTILGPGSGAIAVGDIVAGIDAHVEWGSDGNWHLQNPQTGSGGGAVTSVSNSDGSLTISPTTGAVVGSINYAHAGIWTALETFNAGVSASALTLSAITGSAQCLHVNTSGVVSGTGSDCGAGGGSVNVNGSAVSSPNFNGTTPAAPANSVNGTFAVSGSSVSVSVPNTTTVNGVGCVLGSACTISAGTTIGVQHTFTFTGSGSQAFTHNLGTQYPFYSCATTSGAQFSPTWMTWTDANNVTMNAPAATVTVCNFGQSNTATSLSNPAACPDTSGSGTAQSCTTTPTITVAANACIAYSTTTSNSGTALTLAVNGGAAAPVAIYQNGTWTTTLSVGMIASGHSMLACFDGTDWDVQTPVVASGGAAAPPLPYPPAPSSFAWINQGAFTDATVGNNLVITAPMDSSLNWRIITQSTIATPFRVSAFMAVAYPGTQVAAVASDVGLYLYANPKLVGIEALELPGMGGNNPAEMRVEHIASVTTDGGTVFSNTSNGLSAIVGANARSGGSYVAWCDDGTTLWAQWSSDGVTWSSFYSEAVGSYLTPAQVAFGGVNDSTTKTMTFNLKGWQLSSVASCN